MEIRPCPICESRKRTILFHQTFSGFDGGNLLQSYDVVACDTCGLCFADKIPSQAQFDAYYRDLSKYENQSAELKESPYDIRRFEVTASYLQKFLRKPAEHIMEIGCATGLLLNTLKKKGYTNLTGVDPSPACAVSAKKFYDIKVLTHTLTDISIKDGSADVLILVGVVEHVRDLESAIPKLRNLLSAQGRCFICVPDASQYFRGEDAPFQEFSVEHINFFGPASLGNLFRKHGFKTIDITQAMIEVNHKTITPVLFSIFEKGPMPDEPLKFEPDQESKRNLITYISDCKSREAKVRLAINQIVEKKEPILVWGTGAQTLRLLANSRLNEALISAFVDSNPKYQGKSLNGIPIISPDTLPGRSEAILISTRPYQNEIESQIRNQLHLKNEIIKLY